MQKHWQHLGTQVTGRTQTKQNNSTPRHTVSNISGSAVTPFSSWELPGVA